MAKRKEKQERRSVVLEPDAAGIDIGAEEIYVAVPPDRDEQSTRRFSSFTGDLYALADWLGRCRIKSVAMESTGVYWIPLFQILEARGFKVYLVNAHELKSVPGCKSDVSDCQWIQYLHSVGLLRASFRPPEAICALRTLWRHRGSLLEMAAEHILHMQKALSQMNLQLHHVLSDITGTSGQAILDAILAGQRDPVALAQLCHSRVQSPRDKVAQALVGDYRPEHLFTLKQSLAGYRYYQKVILELDQETARLMQAGRVRTGIMPGDAGIVGCPGDSTDARILRRMPEGRRAVLAGVHEAKPRVAVRQRQLVRVTGCRRFSWLCRPKCWRRLCLRDKPDGDAIDRGPTGFGPQRSALLRY